MGPVAVTLPDNLVDSVHADRSAERIAWLGAVPRLVATYADRWSLDLEPPYQPGGRCAWVAPARDRAGRDVVLKIGWRHDEAADEADGLRAWAGTGTVRLYDHAADESTTVLLLERCHPAPASATPYPNPSRTTSSPACSADSGAPRPAATPSGHCR